MWNIPQGRPHESHSFRRGFTASPDTPMKTAFHFLFSIAFVLGLASSVLANVH